jgi:hypothetical protein
MPQFPNRFELSYPYTDRYTDQKPEPIGVYLLIHKDATKGEAVNLIIKARSYSEARKFASEYTHNPVWLNTWATTCVDLLIENGPQNILYAIAQS